MFKNLPAWIRAGRYHSLYAEPSTLPVVFDVTACAPDGTVMAIEHRELPIAAVQFHPESIMTMENGAGYTLIANAVAGLTRAPAPRVGAGTRR
ncbi:gamma-glutamyl-gamma-aminobutyrate hydrolase family protein [Streptomyces sp. NPDC059819]|uniref:glutamine amidotransferase-related protein n=1 Tax=Streptomyces sp. NPDC059819 TaxID=3346963 RepID=UPI00364AB404